ncbi:MAG: putative deacylase [Parasphingorhabdus sp.]|jgi:predicted deacylase
MKSSFEIAGQLVQSGCRQSIQLELPHLYTHTSASMPIHVVHGRREGPVLLICAAIHGDEINGVEIIRRLLSEKALTGLAGTLIAVPIVNVYGFMSRSRYLPDRRDLNRSFPGSESGSMASRLADRFMTAVFSHCSHAIDLHTGAINRENLPQIRARVEGDEVTRAMALAFGVPVVLNSELRDGSLRESANNLNVPVLLYEAGEALRFDEVSIRAGVKGILGVMAHLGMIRKRRGKPDYQPVISTDSYWVRAGQSGIFRAFANSGDHVADGSVLGYINDPLGDNEIPVTSERGGIVIGKSNLPLVYEGEALFHVACYTGSEAVASQIEEFQVEHDPQQNINEQDEPPLV